MPISSGEDRIFELEKQLHEQYAINNNSNAGTLMSLVGSLLVSITGYSYVLYQYCIGVHNNVWIVHVAAIVAMAVMALLYCLCIALGAGQRMEQFITIGIRKKYYNCNLNGYKEIFPSGYHPFNKDFCSFVQGIYNTISVAILGVILGIVTCQAIAFKSTLYVYIFDCIFIVICIFYKLYKYTLYKDREEDCIDRYITFLNVEKRSKQEPKCSMYTLAIIVIVSALSSCFVVTKHLSNCCDIRTEKNTNAQVVVCDCCTNES